MASNEVQWQEQIMHHFVGSVVRQHAHQRTGPLPPRTLTLWGGALARKRADGNKYAPPKASRELVVHAFAPMLKSGGRGGIRMTNIIKYFLWNLGGA